MELLRRWVNETLPASSRKLDDFEGDMANGYLFAQLLDQHGLLPPSSSLTDNNTPASKVANLMVVQQPLLDLGVKFNSKIANELMTETKGTAVNMCYQLKLGLENAKTDPSKPGGARQVTKRGKAEPVLLASTLKSTRQLLTGHERMQAEHFESLVKQQVQDPKQLAVSLSLSKYTEHMIKQQMNDEELDALRAEQYEAMVAQRRQLELAKLHEGKRLMADWQADGYAKHAQNLQRRKEDEKYKLRFELSRRSKKASALSAATAFAADDMVSGVDEFERTLSRLQTDTDAGGDEDLGAVGALSADVSAAEHLRKLESLLPSSKAMDAESKQYLGRLRTKRLEEEAARKEREMRRRKVMLEQDAAQAQLEEQRREELILSKLARQCAEERKIGEQLWIARKEKDAIRKNRALHDQQLAEAAKEAELRRREEDQRMGAAARQEYAETLALERERAAENEAARQAVTRQKHEDTCRKIAEQLVALAGRVVDFRSTTQPLLPAKVMRDWTTLFKAGVPLDAPADVDTPHVEEVTQEEGAAESEAAGMLHEAELDIYLAAADDWSTSALGVVEMPEGCTATVAEVEMLTPVAAEAGSAQTGRMVLEFIETISPPPAPLSGAGLPSALIKVALLGRPFAGKSLQAQRLAESHMLQVIIPQEVIEQAVAAAKRYDEEVAAAAEEAAAAAEEGAEPPLPAPVAEPPTLELARKAMEALPGVLPDEVVVGLVVNAIEAVDPVSYKGFVLDSFPRTVAQAMALEKALTGFEPPPKDPPKKGSKVAPPPPTDPVPKAPHVPGLDVVVRLDVPDETARRRALGRRLDPQTGIVYHLEFEPPVETEDELGPTFNGINGRLVQVEGAADQEATLPGALTAYSDAQAPLEEWYTGEPMGVLAPIPAEGVLEEVGEAVSEAVSAALVTKEERIAERQAFEDNVAAEAAAAEAEAAAVAEAAAAAEAARAEAEAEGLEPPAAAPAAAASAEPLATEATEALYAQWQELESSFVDTSCGSMARLRQLQWTALQRLCTSRTELVSLLTAPDAREREVLDAQERFNSMPIELRLSESGKAELHMVVQDLQEALYALSDERRVAAEKLMNAMADDGWLPSQALQLTLAILALAQSEADRYAATSGLLHAYCSLRSQRDLPFTPPPLAELPVVEAVDFHVPAPSDGSAPEPVDDKKGKGKAPPPKGGKDAPPVAQSPQATLLAAISAIVASHCEPIEAAEPPPAAEEDATAEAKRAAEWAATLHFSLVGERAKLRRRLAAILRYGCTTIEALKGQVVDMFAQLDTWVGERQKSEADSVGSLVTIMQRAIEADESLPHSLQLQGDQLLIDEALLMKPPPPQPPVAPPAPEPLADGFTVPQLGGLVTKLRAAAAGMMLSGETLKSVFSRLGAAGFDATSPPLPKTWWPLGPPAYTDMAALFCPEGRPKVAWPEVFMALAANTVSPPSEEEIVAMLTAAAEQLGRADLLGAPAAAEAEAAAPAPAEAPTVPPARAGLLLERAAYDALPLWFEGSVPPQPDGYDVLAEFKALLFDAFSDQSSGTLDFQQMLLYTCDSSAKAFAVLGFHTQRMLSLDGLYELLHREPVSSDLEKPEHLDVYSRAALKRLFTDLKLSTTEAAPHSLVAANPQGHVLLSSCAAYIPKDVYGLVAAITDKAGRSLNI